MKVKLYATMRLKVGQKLVNIATTPNTTVRQVMAELTARYPALKEGIWNESGGLVDYCHVLVNGRNVRYLSGLDTPLQPDDTMDIFPPVGGG
jgi:molybdopterin synthase sulfur carrier subunit